MPNLNAQLINEKLGVKIFNPDNERELELIAITKAAIKKLQIDDLINPETKQQTLRLRNLVKEILKEKGHKPCLKLI